jgi:hypothetical protein
MHLEIQLEALNCEAPSRQIVVGHERVILLFSL